MNGTCLATLRSDRERLLKERGRLDKLIASFTAIIAHYEAEPQQTHTVPIRDAIHEVLTEAGEPLHYREIHARLIARGVHVSGQNPSKNVGAHLSLDRRFENCDPGIWRIRPKGPSLAALGAPHAEGR